jgi:hypothetical protein
MRLSRHLDALIRSHSEFEAFTQHLSITTFRYVPSELKPQIGSPAVEKRIDEINQTLLTRVEKSGEAFLSNAVVNGKFALRACIELQRLYTTDRRPQADWPILIVRVRHIQRDAATMIVTFRGTAPPSQIPSQRLLQVPKLRTCTIARWAELAETISSVDQRRFAN